MPINRPRRQRAALFIAVNPVGSGFAKNLQQGLKDTGVLSLRCSREKGVDHQRRGRKVFFVTGRTYNKVEQLNAFKAAGVSCPAFTTDPAKVGELGSKHVFARTLINSTSGRGIVEFESGDTPPRAPLYTAYIPKKAEYRVHVFNGKAVDVQQKKKKRGFEGDRDTRIRNVANGYVYVRDGVEPPANMLELAVNAVRALNYNYGAVDIIYNEKQNQCYVLEVNSRPGLMGTTLEKYVNAVKEIL